MARFHEADFMGLGGFFKKTLPEVLQTALPIIATATGIGGPLLPIVARQIGRALNKDVPPTEDGINTAIIEASAADPDALLKLKQVDANLELELAKIGLTADQLAASDRANARAREVALGGRDRVPMILAFTTTAGFFLLLTVLIFRGVPQTSHDIVIGMTSILGGMTVGVNGYYFGSSSGSAKKTDAILSATK
jgi:hypothetical protein